MRTLDTQVLIVGGGVAGLSSAIMLGQLDVDAYLVERHPGTAREPRAHIIHCRTLEIFQQWGMEEAVRKAGSPPENFMHTSWYTSLGGERSWDGKLITSIPSWSFSALEPYYTELTASPMANLPQHLLEPMLRSEAERLHGDDRIRYSHQLLELTQSETGAVASILDKQSGETYQVRAQYVVGADGGKTLGPMLGIGMLGPAPFVDVVSLTFDADFSPYLLEDSSLIRLFLQPDVDGTVRRFSIVASGPDDWGRHCRRWRSGVVLPVGSELRPEDYTVENAVSDLRGLFRLPDLVITDVAMSHWLIESLYAERFRAGRTFLVGDAAHRHSPMGGLGLNTGVQDVHNLAWKLAAVLHGYAPDSLLDSYEAERLPIGRRRVEFATFSFFNHLSVAGAFGTIPGASEEHNRAALEALFSDTADGETRRAQLEEMIGTLRREFQHADLDLGFEYADSPVVVPDGSPAPPRDPVGHDYVPVARPGHRLPHAWFERNGARVATHHLFGSGSFVLIAGAEAQGACDAALELGTEMGVPLQVHRVAPDGDLMDVSGAWAGLRGHGAAGAVLVRPDGHVAYRSQGAADYEVMKANLRDALRVALSVAA